MNYTSKEFVIWLKGFITASYPLNPNSPIIKIEEELNKVDDKVEFPFFNPIATTLINVPNTNTPVNTGRCIFPTNCGMPKTWFGIVPPVCNKCGYKSKSLNTTYNNSFGNVNDTSLPTFDNTNSNDNSTHHNHD
jgi:hypothetical protein